MTTEENGRPIQATLPIAGIEDLLEDKKGNFNDPAFASNKSQPVHRWVPWIAGYSFDFVRDILARFGDGAGVVLDPFAGVGTTLLEANLAGYDAVGFEINPYAAMASRVKTRARRVDDKAFEHLISRFAAYYRDKVGSDYRPQSEPPPGFRTRSPFYSSKVMRKVLIFRDFLAAIAGRDESELFEIAFAATMVTYSNYSYEPSLGRRVSAGKSEIHDYPVGDLLERRLRQMLADIRWLQRQAKAAHTQTRVINASFFNYEAHLAPESVDLAITSPPYLNNYHYNRNTRPHLYWLGFIDKPQDMRPLAQENFGKYWQTVRDLERVELAFDLPDSDLGERLSMLRDLNEEKGVYGGNGWANYAASYFNDCYRFAQGLSYVLRDKGAAFVVIGNSILQGLMFPTDVYFAQIAELVGLKLEQIDVPRSARVGNSIIQSSVRVAKAKKKHSLYEAIVELRKG
jgi:hypothetical protein